jgi:hypothetical protein
MTPMPAPRTNALASHPGNKAGHEDAQQASVPTGKVSG